MWTCGVCRSDLSSRSLHFCVGATFFAGGSFFFQNFADGTACCSDADGAKRTASSEIAPSAKKAHLQPRQGKGGLELDTKEFDFGG